MFLKPILLCFKNQYMLVISNIVYAYQLVNYSKNNWCFSQFINVVAEWRIFCCVLRLDNLIIFVKRCFIFRKLAPERSFDVFLWTPSFINIWTEFLSGVLAAHFPYFKVNISLGLPAYSRRPLQAVQFYSLGAESCRRTIAGWRILEAWCWSS